MTLIEAANAAALRRRVFLDQHDLPLVMDDFPRYSCIFHTRAAVVECLLIMCSLHGYMDNKWKNRLASTICSQVILYVVVRSYLNPEDGGTGVSEALFLRLGDPLLALHPCFFGRRK